MKTLVLASSFKRAFKRLIRREPELQKRIEERLILLAADPFDPLLQTHKLKGKLTLASLKFKIQNSKFKKKENIHTHSIPLE